MTWDNDGRATFSYGVERVAGQPHVIWRRVGTHDIFTPPPGPSRAGDATAAQPQA